MNLFKEHMNPYLGRLLENLKMDKTYIKGEGSYLYDAKGNKYLDLIAAYGALPFGYNPEEIWDVVLEVHANKEPSFMQPSTLNFAGALAEKLIEVTPKELKYVTFTNSGAEAVEAAIKLCRSATNRLGILSTTNSFHGKTLGALSATGNKKYHSSFGAPADGFNHIQYGSLEELVIELQSKPDYYAAFIVEPIQGEGGIIEPERGYLKAVKTVCEKYGVKLIVDEIQTGLGRIGKLFAIEHEEVVPDVLLLSKALGGGIFPIGACISAEEVYNKEFALNHSSTFANNTLGCKIGLKVLELLTEDESILNDVNEKGNLFKDRLILLKEKYPNIIKSIRGRGLMLGIEFDIQRQTFPNSLLSIMAEQDLLTPIISSYLLNVEKVRVAPTLNGNKVIRIEPSLNISEKDIKIALEAIENMLYVLNKGNTAKFLSFLIDKTLDKEFEAENNTILPRLEPPTNDYGRFGFLIHPLELKNYIDFDSSLSLLSEDELNQLTGMWGDMVEPFVVSETKITSQNGGKAYGEFIVVPRTAEEISTLPKGEAIGEIKKAIKLAKDRGAKIVGLGAYTSVVSGGGLYVKDEGISITTGNSYTIVSAIDAVMKALEGLDKKAESSIAAIVGATGSIGYGAALLISEKVSKLILIGNPSNAESSIKRLYKISGKIYKHLATMEHIHTYHKCSVIWERIKEYNPPSWDAPVESFTEFAHRLDRHESPIIITTDIHRDLLLADIVISATSSVARIIRPEHLKQGAIVCDMSRPRNVSEDVELLRPDVLVIEGGVIEIPGRPSLGVNVGLKEGYAFACMAETMMLALEKHYEHTSLGASGISIENILLTRKLGNKHGFKISI
ncbi:aminotransferase class III-fold pyridoxal phosphate-dependent enzyme [Proteiniborus sp. MB09-C3]|uniref:aminotransferase class III-fold pyridoxal phosphate-dependent enzyme n=1 Tax=Proteiniborus sp. MB09-C3 TaxID=3050072 RepID=UPI00255321A7|nr:aminotransferase class III-fold pyridoxal phosphate-dependent enzyme [Proteiniborus sp. MB09-C3]WIV12096.1 aminotransferase class III-fold pyridoxal phosphate-dependent enzyme [Proteiniborus sp. MB09-C3]